MRDPELPLRLFLPAYLAVYILVTYTLNVAGFIRKYRLDPRVTDRSDPVLHLCQVYRDLLFGALIVVVGVYAVAPDLYPLFVPVPALHVAPVRYAGAALLLVALLVVRLAQHQLGPAWRIGVDRSGTPTDLVTSGLYRVSRNPIAVGMVLSAWAFFLALPNMVTFTIANLAVFIFQVRIRIEEQHLVGLHGQAYLDYQRTTPRWLAAGRRP